MENMSVDGEVEKILVLFGLDSQRKPRAARFNAQDQPTVVRMALDLGLRVAIAAQPNELVVARKIVRGTAHAAERKDVPDISWGLYRQLNEMVGGEIGAICTSRPKRHDHIGPSHVVLAETKPGGAWRPAFVLRRTGGWLALNWRDRPRADWFSREIDAVAILPGR